MYKSNENSGSTKLLRKTKVSKNGTHDKSKIMLTDLCVEEKAKVGQLIKTLQCRKNQNIELTQQLNELRNKYNHQHMEVVSLKEELEKSEERERQLQTIIEKMSERQKQQEVQWKQLTERVQSKRQVITVDQFAMTEPIIQQNQSCQVQPKKKKQKSKLIQTDKMEEKKRDSVLVRPMNSKSFDKIMRKKELDDLHSFKEKAKPKRQSKYVEKEDQENEEQEEQFQQLAQKWLQLKERNLTKIKNSAKKSKHSQEEESPTSFKEQQIYQYNDSFGPQKEEEQVEFDDIQLNKILKSKNFRASRLLNQQSSNRGDSEESVKRRSGERKKMKMSSSNSRPIDFYETDLLDLVSSINNPH